MTICADTFAAVRARGIKTVRLVIYQPKVYAEPQVWTCTLDELEAFAALANSKAAMIKAAMRDADDPDPSWAATYLHPNPNADDCAFCKAMATCPAYNRAVDTGLAEVGLPAVDAFSEVTEEAMTEKLRALPADRLAAGMASVDMIEGLCTAMRAEVERRLLANELVPGFGLELGRKGARKWADPVIASDVLRKQFRLTVEQAHNLKLKSPTQIEELTKPDPETGKPAIGPRQWKTLTAMVTQAEPKPSVKPVKAIKRPYLPQPEAAAFTPVVESDDSLT